MKANLSSIVDGLEMVSEMNQVYYNPETGEVDFVLDEIIGSYDEEEDERIPDGVLFLPSSFEINEYSIMEDFAYSLENQDMRQELLWAISGRGAFRHFKHFIHQYNIQEEWFDFKHEAYTKIALEWCDQNEIAYE